MSDSAVVGPGLLRDHSSRIDRRRNAVIADSAKRRLCRNHCRAMNTGHFVVARPSCRIEDRKLLSCPRT
jgi:hypothetical protein